jgi:precorrin-2 dehydrogenase / sirohydrochlorin ferrochelatase
MASGRASVRPRLLRRFARRRRSSTPAERVRALLERWGLRGRRWETRRYYPAILDLAGRTALVVGGGKVGEGKVRGLLDAGARVRVVSLEATEQVRRWADDGAIELQLRAYETADLDGCFLVVAATERNETNVRVFEDAEARQMLCNVVDVTPLCNFILPSIMRRGDLAIAVSTGGASPALARQIRLSMEECYGDEYALAMQLLGSLREELKERYPDPEDRKVVFERMVYSELMDLIREGDTDAIEAWVERCIAEGPRYVERGEHARLIAAARARAGRAGARPASASSSGARPADSNGASAS